MTEQLEPALSKEMAGQIARSPRTWLVLDYDGTLADFAPTPDTLLPDEALIALISRLARHSGVLRVMILSGRRFSHIQTLLPVPGILLAGTYGIEYQTWEGAMGAFFDMESERPELEKVKHAWSALIEGRDDFYLEDKGYTLALHGSRASDADARAVLSMANQAAAFISERAALRVLGGYKFLEIAPTVADKGQSLTTFLERFPWPGAKIVYIGDDDKDEQAFAVVREREGIPILVAEKPRPSLALYRLSSPAEVRQWLALIANHLEASRPAKGL
jgi:trehalose 6-phosphate phosphatase